VPAQPVDHPGSFADDLIAIVTEHADLDRVLVAERLREALDPVTHHGQRHCARVDRIRLSRMPRDPPRLAGHRGRDPDHPLAGSDQRRFQARGHVPAVLDRPHPFLLQTTGEPQSLKRSSVAGRDRQLPAYGPRLPVHRDQHVVALVSVCPNHDHVPRPFVEMARRKRTIRRTPLSRGAATLLSSHAGGPRSVTGDTAKVSQTTLVDSDKESQPATGRETNRPAGQHRSNTTLSLSDKDDYDARDSARPRPFHRGSRVPELAHP
jgi:hypothetical protein